MNVPFIDLSHTTSAISAEYLERTKALLAKNRFILTEEVEQFEHAWASTIGAAHAVGVSNGSDALYLALRALDIGPGDEVITQGNAYNASVVAILRTGATVRFVDIQKDSLTLDTEAVQQHISARTKAILPVHLFGQSCDLRRLKKIAETHNVYIVEDCAQSHLAQYAGIHTGTWGDIAAFSFYPTKNLGAFGDAGAIVTNRSDLADRVRHMRNLGSLKKNEHDMMGYNMRLDPLQAIALSLKLPHLQEWTRMRRAAAARYDALLKGVASVHIPSPLKDASHVYHLYVVHVDRRDAVRAALAERGVHTEVHYPVPVYRQPFYEGEKVQREVSDWSAEHILSLPLFPYITAEQQSYVARVLADTVASQ